MASRLPKFGAWEGGQNITVQFDNARKKKTNGQMINPNDPQDNPDMFPQYNNGGGAPPAPSAQPPKGKRGGIPQFGAWENGDNNDNNNAGYTAIFESVQKTKNGPSPTFPNEPQMNRDMMQAQAEAQIRPQPKPAKLEPQQAPRSKVPTFGSWDASEGEFGYTECFDNVRKNTNGRTVTPEPPSNVVAPVEEGRAKVPQFGAWEEGDNNGGAYTAYFENARKKKGAEPVLDPQLNREVNNRVRPQPANQQYRNGSRGSNSSSVNSSFETAAKYGKQNPGGQTPPNNQRGGRLQPKPPAGRGNQTPERGAAIPAWGVWQSDPSQAEGFTGAFRRAKDERNTPNHPSAPQQFNQHSQAEPKSGCCFGWF